MRIRKSWYLEKIFAFPSLFYSFFSFFFFSFFPTLSPAENLFPFHDLCANPFDFTEVWTEQQSKFALLLCPSFLTCSYHWPAPDPSPAGLGNQQKEKEGREVVTPQSCVRKEDKNWREMEGKKLRAGWKGRLGLRQAVFVGKGKRKKTPRYLAYYNQILSDDITLCWAGENSMKVPNLVKIVLNFTSKSVVQENKRILPALLALEIISGQKVKITWARKSIAAFKLREEMMLGCKATLRGLSMYQFLEKVVTILLPKVLEFQIESSLQLDQGGNYNFGISNLLIFRELHPDFELFESLQGINLTLVASNNKKKENRLLLSGLQLPYLTPDPCQL